jgi:hypothetical protein
MECSYSHDDVHNVTMNMLQKSNGTTQYQCKHCHADIIKAAGTDFNRLYKNVHKLCVDHTDVELTPYVPLYTNEDGKSACKWCGQLM